MIVRGLGLVAAAVTPACRWPLLEDAHGVRVLALGIVRILQRQLGRVQPPFRGLRGTSPYVEVVAVLARVGVVLDAGLLKHDHHGDDLPLLGHAHGLGNADHRLDVLFLRSGRGHAGATAVTSPALPGLLLACLVARNRPQASTERGHHAADHGDNQGGTDNQGQGR